MSSDRGRFPMYMVWILAGATASAGAGAVVIWKMKQKRDAEKAARIQAADAMGEGRALFTRGEYQRAIDALEEALELQPDLAEAADLLEQAKQGLKTHEEAKRKQAEEQRRRDEKRKEEIREHDFQLKTARKMLEIGRMDEAMEAVQKALDVVPGSPDAIQLLKQIEKSKAKLAEDEHDRERRRVLEEARARMAHGLALKSARMMFDRGDYEGARDFAAEALKHMPDSAEAKDILEAAKKKVTEELSQKREAADEEKLARERARVHHDVALGAAEEALADGAVNLARKYVEEALEAVPESEEAAAFLKEVEKAEKEAKDRAEKDEFARALKQVAHDRALASGREFLKAGNYEAAKRLALQALEALPESVEARKLYDEATAKQKEAATAARTEKKREHDLAVAQARAELAEKKLDPARAHAERALKLIPGSPEALDLLKQIASAGAAARAPDKAEKSERFLDMAQAYLDRSLLDGAEYFARKALVEDPQSGRALAILQEIGSDRVKLEHEKMREERERERRDAEEKLKEMMRKLEEEKKAAQKKVEEGRLRSEAERRKAQEDLAKKADELAGIRDDLEKLLEEARQQREVAPVAVVNVGGSGTGPGGNQAAELVAKGYERLSRNELDGARAAGTAALELRPGYLPAQTLLEEVRKRRAPAAAPRSAPSRAILARLDRALEDEDVDALSGVLGQAFAAREIANAKEFFALASEIKVTRTQVTPAPSSLKSDWTISYMQEGERVSCALSTEYTVLREGEEERIVATKDLR